ncbi:sensor histidine kinase [Orenia marismortui]|uniref:sensor histidine kinase n=1 Tax=Orenia marismortui TaxID=46469 RepID=UPI00037FFEC1|nr:HAMP domain-containing sensor histidine kinase [Orenia marismortui]
MFKMCFANKSFMSRLITSYIIIILLTLTIVGAIFGYLFHNYYSGLKEWKLSNKGQRIAKLVNASFYNKDLDLDMIKNKLNTIAHSSNMDIGIINYKGKIIFDSTQNQNNSLDIKKKEIIQVLKGNKFSKKILGPDNKSLIMIFPLIQDNGSIILEKKKFNRDKIIGGIVIQTAIGNIAETINEIIKITLYSFLIAIVAASFLSFFFSKRVTKPLADINKSAKNIAKGKFEIVPLPKSSSREIRSLVDTFNYAVAEIDDTLEKKRRLENVRKEFVANVSHEFRAPLTTIKGFLEIILGQDLEQDELREYLEIMYKDTEYLEYLLEDLLVLSRLDSKRIILNKENIHPKVLVKRAVSSLQSKFKSKSLKVKLKISESLPKIFVDVNRMHQVLINLLDNGINYSPEGGRIEIMVDFSENQQGVRFSIADEGIGIATKDLDKIWQRFYKVDSARTREAKKGNGLGLAIVKEIINKHDAKIKVVNNSHGGATFSFVINKKNKI